MKGWCVSLQEEDSGGVRMVKTCIVKGCKSRTSDRSECRFFSIPAVPRHLDEEIQQLWTDRQRSWILAAGHDPTEFELKNHHRMCSVHFISGISVISVLFLRYESIRTQSKLII